MGVVVTGPVRTGSPLVSSTPMKPSSRPLAKPESTWLTDLGRSCPSASERGLAQVNVEGGSAQFLVKVMLRKSWPHFANSICFSNSKARRRPTGSTADGKRAALRRPRSLLFLFGTARGSAVTCS